MGSPEEVDHADQAQSPGITSGREVTTFIITEHLPDLVDAFLLAYMFDSSGGPAWTDGTAGRHLVRAFDLCREYEVVDLFLVVTDVDGRPIAATFPFVGKEGIQGFELFVAPEHQGQGIVTILIEELTSRLADKPGYQEVPINLVRSGIGTEELPPNVTFDSAHRC